MEQEELSLEDRLNAYFTSIGLKEIPDNDKDRLTVLRNILSNCESELTELDQKYSGLVRDDANLNEFVNRARCLENGYFKARGFIFEVKGKMRIERKENIKAKIKSIFKK